MRGAARPLTSSPSAIKKAATAGERGAQELESGGHLDADELNSYAENAMACYRAWRYMTHLADCDSCRKAVTDLVLASGVVKELEKQAVPQTDVPSRSWRDWLALLFAPRVLRYAASVVLIVGITAIAFKVYRDGRQMKFASQEEQADSVATTGENRNGQPVLAREVASNTNQPAAAAPQIGATPQPDATGASSLLRRNM